MALRKQLEKTNIDVIEILPPVVETQMTAGQNHSKMSPVTCAGNIIEQLKIAWMRPISVKRTFYAGYFRSHQTCSKDHAAIFDRFALITNRR